MTAITVLLMGSLVAGCAGYRSLSLPVTDSLSTDVAAIHVPADTFPAIVPQTHRFDPTDGLDMWETAMLAVANNPTLRAERRKYGVAEAQLYAAHLFPDPEVSMSLDHPTSSGPGLVDGYSGALIYDVIALVTHNSAVRTANSAAKQISLDLLWQEWQTVERARSLHVELRTIAKKIELLEGMLALYQRRYRHSSRAMRAGDLTVDVAGTDLTALLDAATELNQLRQTQNDKEHALALLLGISASAELTLKDVGLPMPLSRDQVEQALREVPQRRPDLLALAAGYASQEARLRTAVLSQFPSLGLGISRARDTSAVYTSGLSVSLNLPLFSGNRGNIAVERATREQLRAEYQARIDQNTMDVARLMEVQILIEQQQRLLEARVPELESMVENARRAYQNGDIGALTFLNMQTTLINKKLEQLDLEQQLWSTRMAMDTLLGTISMDQATDGALQ